MTNIEQGRAATLGNDGADVPPSPGELSHLARNQAALPDIEALGQIDPGTVIVWRTDNQSPSVVAPMQKALVQAAGHADFLLLVCGQGSDLSQLDEDAMMAAGWVKASSVADQMFTVDMPDEDHLDEAILDAARRNP